jgi:DNA repair protein RecN (Recombination protein N)
MLRHLHIQNYAIIEEIEINFSEGLQVITGETGAGKSIIAGALSLVLGERADTGILRHRDRKAFVEAGFSVSHLAEVEKFLIAEELDHNQDLILRREISPNGKSRAFVNDTPVNLEQLRKLCILLVDLHQQFDLQYVGEAGFQLDVIDALASNSSFCRQYRSLFQQLQSCRRQLEELKQKQTTADKEHDYQLFLFNELNEMGLKGNEIEDAELQLNKQSHVEAIKSVLQSIHFNLEYSEQPLTQQLRSISHQLEPYYNYHEKFPEIIQRLSSVYIEVQDLAGEIESINNGLSYDVAEIDRLNERVHLGYKLFKKHQVSSTAGLIGIRTELGEKLTAALNIAEEIHVKEKAVESLVKEATELAGKLSTRRKAQIKGFEEKVNGLLQKVGMPNARIRVECGSTPLNDQGMDSIEFLFDANKSDRFEPLKKVASGGELSRLMLCIKSLVAQSMDMPTLLFDEIDSGISGEAARQVGLILKELSRSRQVICITHQPQIAGKGSNHFYVYKEVVGDTVNTKIRLLDPESRIVVIAKMLSGEKPTAAAMENARELVN